MSILAELGLLILAGLLITLSGPLWLRLGPRRVRPAFELSRRQGLTLLGVLCLAYVAVFGSLAVRQHLALHSQSYDLGIFDQVFWNSAAGRLFQNTLMSDSPLHLGHHLSFTLLALVPFYWLWSDPRTLLILQTVLLSLAAIPIYLTAQKRLGAGAALVIAACYLLYPALGYVNLFDFHEVALAVPLLALALYLLIEERYVPLYVCLAAILFTKEDMAFLIIAFGLYFLLVKRKPAAGAALVAVGAAYIAAALRWIIPSFQREHVYIFAGLYAYLGSTPSEVLVTALTRPQLVIEHLLSAANAQFVLRLLAPLMALPLLGWQAGLIALPTLAYLLLSGDSRTTNVNYQYTAVLIPPLFFALVEGARRVTVRWPAVRSSLLAALLVVSIGSYYLHGRGLLSRNYHSSLYSTDGRAARGRAFMAQIPADAPVSAQNNLGPHLSERDRLYLFPEIFDAEYVVLDLGGDSWPLERGTPGSYDQAVARLQADPAWRLLSRDREFLLFGRQALPNPVRYTLGDCIELDGYEAARSPGNLHVRLFWRATCRPTRAYTVFLHVEKPGDAPGRILAQSDGQPGGGDQPTNTWEPGRVVTDEHDILLGSGMDGEALDLKVGMYYLPDGSRLPVRDANARTIGDSIALTGLQANP